MGNRESTKRPHEQLNVWRDAMSLGESTYRITESFPSSGRFGLTAQARRAAVSVPSNIAEGAARRSRVEYLRFLSIARGSLAELETQMQIAARPEFMKSDESMDELLNRTFSRLNALTGAVSKNSEANVAPLATESRTPNPESRC
jgi:four helix bundle protein